jgi:hypothetical protein
MISLRRTAVVGAGLLLALVAGCGRSPDPAPTSATTPPATEAGTPTVTESATAGSSTTPSAQPATEITIRGIVAAGVEPGCTVLEVDSGPPYLLLGGDESVLKIGARVEVVGLPRPDLATTCQQGTPLQVSSAQPL